ncbi:MAG: PAS domain S-box protein [Anaerolineae bacterium]
MADQPLFEYIPISYLSLDENGRVLAMNQLWLDLFDYPHDQVMGRSISEFLEPESTSHFQQHWPNLIKTGQVENVRLEMRHASGEKISVTLDGRSEYDQQGRFQQTHCFIHTLDKKANQDDRHDTADTISFSQREENAAPCQQAQQIINQSGVIIFLWLAQENWPVEFVSDNIRQLGYEPDSFYEQQILYAQIIHPDDLEQVIGEVAHQSARGAQEFVQEYRLITQANETRWVEVHMIVRRGRNGRATHYQGVVLDITDKKETEFALRASQMRYRQMFESHSSIQWLVDAATQKIVDVNPAAAKFYGYTRQQMRGMNVSDLNVLSPEEIKANMMQAQSQNRSYFEMPHRLASGEIRLVEIHSGPIQVKDRPLLYAILHDITERKEAEEALRQTNRELAVFNRVREALNSTLDVDRVLKLLLDEICFLLDAVAGSIWLLDSTKGELVCRAVTKSQRAIIQGWRLPIELGIAGWVATNKRSLNLPDAQLDKRHYKEIDRRTDMTTRALLCVPMLVQQRAIGVIQITDSKSDRFNAADLSLVETLADTAAAAVENARLHEQLEEYTAHLESRITQRTQELVDANKKLTELGRLKTKLIEDISHELRTPITALSLYLDLLEKGRQENQQKYLTVLREKINELIHLTESILEVFRLDLYKGDVDFKPVNVNDIVMDAVNDCQQRIDDSGLEFIVELDERPLPIHAAPQQMRQVFTNLINNAISFTSSGQVQVKTEAAQEKKSICISVIDDGIGITAEEIPYIFDRFFRGQQIAQFNIPGTGLGLSVVQDIVRLHDGQVEVESQPGEGSCFRIWLPMAVT